MLSSLVSRANPNRTPATSTRRHESAVVGSRTSAGNSTPYPSSTHNMVGVSSMLRLLILMEKGSRAKIIATTIPAGHPASCLPNHRSAPAESPASAAIR
jgi:hypothetical protein